MGDNKKSGSRSRRSFLSILFSGDTNAMSGKGQSNTEKVKMLTADGKLVEVDKTVLEKAAKNKRASNKDILHWMKNPSKKIVDPFKPDK